MDAFYASVEQRDNPDLKGKPVAVGGDKDRGVVAAASYEARKFGVHSAMASKIAYQRCPELIFVKPRFEVYKEVSNKVRAIFNRYTDLIEPLSLDEAYLDVTENKKGMLSATHIALEIKKSIKEELNLVASAGISVNKFLAKIASDMDKPDGLFVIPPDKIEGFIEQLEVSKIFGVGKVTAEKMYKLGIFRGKDLKKWSREALESEFGKSGNYFYSIARGIDNREVKSDRKRKSLGAESTFDNDLYSINDLHHKLDRIAERVFERLQKAKVKGKTITLKVKFSDFSQVTRSRTEELNITGLNEIQQLAKVLLEQLGAEIKPIRLLGISLSNFQNDATIRNNVQLTLEF